METINNPSSANDMEESPKKRLVAAIIITKAVAFTSLIDDSFCQMQI